MTLLDDLREAFAAGGTMWNTRAYAEARNAEARVRLNALAVRVRAGELGVHPDQPSASVPATSLDGYASLDWATNWSTLLSRALSLDARDLVLALLETGADPHATCCGECPPPQRSSYDQPPLMTALADSPTSVALLLARGADPNGGNDSRPPLTEAVWNGDAESVRLLLQAGADPLALTSLGHTALVPPGSEPLDAECVRLVRAAMAPLLKARKGASVRAKRGAPGHAGLREMVKAAHYEDGSFQALLLRRDAATFAQAMASALGACIEADAHKRWVDEPEGGHYAVVQFKGRPWSVAWLEHAKRFPSGPGLELALTLSQGDEVVALTGPEAHVYRDGALAEHHCWAPSASETEEEEDEDGEVNGYEARIAELVEQFVAWCEAREIFVPSIFFADDGVCAGLRVQGVKKADIVDALLVCLPRAHPA